MRGVIAAAAILLIGAGAPAAIVDYAAAAPHESAAARRAEGQRSHRAGQRQQKEAQTGEAAPDCRDEPPENTEERQMSLFHDQLEQEEDLQARERAGCSTEDEDK